jgi:hypothetical protein
MIVAVNSGVELTSGEQDRPMVAAWLTVVIEELTWHY